MKTMLRQIAGIPVGFVFLLAMIPTVVTHHILVVAKCPRSVDKLITDVYAILEAMTDNAWFPTPSPTLASVKTKNDDLKDAQVAAKSKAPGGVQARNAKKAILIKAVYALRDYCQSICDANPELAETIALSALFHVKKVAIKQKRTFQVKQLNSGSVELSSGVKGHQRAHEWCMSYSPDDPVSWYVTIIPATTKAKTVVDNIKPGAKVYFRHRVNTKDGPSDWDQTISLIVI